MSGYFEFVIAFKLKNDTPQVVREILYIMSDDSRFNDFDNYQDHPFFDTNWLELFAMNSGKFSGETHVSFDGLGLDIRVHVKDNFNNEIQTFLHWIAPYSKNSGFVGYYLQEDDQNPNLIYFSQDKAFLYKVMNPKITLISIG